MKAIFILASCSAYFVSGATYAIESRLTSTASLFPFSQERAQTLSYIESSTEGATLLERLASESFHNEALKREKEIQALPKKESDALSEFRRLLLTEGFEAFDLISNQSTPRFEKKLNHSICVVLQSKHPAKKKIKPVLLTTKLSDAKTTAAVFGLAKLLQAFHIETEKGLWVCAQTEPTARSTKELLGKNPARSPYALRLVLEGESNKAYVNFLGKETTEFVIRDRAWSWLKKDTNAASDASLKITQALQGLRHSWENDKQTPWAKTTVSPISCEKSYLSSVRNTCRFSVTVTSRSRAALSERNEALVTKALKELKGFNQSIPSAKGKATVTLLLPKNNGQFPFAGNPDSLPILSDWTVALGPDAPKDSFVSTRFIDSEFAGFEANHIPTVLFSVANKERSEETRLLSVLAKTLLLHLDAQVQ